MRQIILLIAMTCWVGSASCECFHTVAEASHGHGVQDGVGFRLEGVRVDRVGGAVWAKVISCQHPERPGVTVPVVNPGTIRPENTMRATALPPIVHAGEVVSVLRVETWARVETAGVVQEAGALGSRVRVRLTAGEQGGEARFVLGLVRSTGLVEVEAER